MKKALIFGASGNVGGYLLHELLNDANYGSIIAVVRSELKTQDQKLKTLISDFYSLQNIKDKLVADDVFIIIGSADKHIERHYPVLAASIAKANGAASIFVVTAVGANPKSLMAYTRLKGEIEQDILDLDFKHSYFFRPGMIMGKREQYRPMEKTMMASWTIISPLFFGSLIKYKGMEAKQIARAMHQVASKPDCKVGIYHWQDMQRLI